MCTISTFTFEVFTYSFLGSLCGFALQTQPPHSSQHASLYGSFKQFSQPSILLLCFCVAAARCWRCLFSTPQYSSLKRAQFSISDFLLLLLLCCSDRKKKCNNVYLCPVYSVKEWMEKSWGKTEIKRARFTPGVCWKIINIIKIVINYSL